MLRYFARFKIFSAIYRSVGIVFSRSKSPQKYYFINNTPPTCLIEYKNICYPTSRFTLYNSSIINALPEIFHGHFAHDSKTLIESSYVLAGNKELKIQISIDHILPKISEPSDNIIIEKTQTDNFDKLGSFFFCYNPVLNTIAKFDTPKSLIFDNQTTWVDSVVYVSKATLQYDRPDFSVISIGENREFTKLVNLFINKLEVHGNQSEIRIDNCIIQFMEISGHISELKIQGTWFGTFIMNSRCICNLEFINGGVFDIDVKNLEGTPITGNTLIHNVGALVNQENKRNNSSQSYRTLQNFFQHQGNRLAQNWCRTVALAIEQQDEPFPLKILNCLYYILSKYGTSLYRPLIFFGISIASIQILFFYFGLDIYTELKNKVDNNSIEYIESILMLSVQSILTPFKLYKEFGDLRPASNVGHIILFVHGIFSDFFLIFFAFAVNNRFAKK